MVLFLYSYKVVIPHLIIISDSDISKLVALIWQHGRWFKYQLKEPQSVVKMFQTHNVKPVLKTQPSPTPTQSNPVQPSS